MRPGRRAPGASSTIAEGAEAVGEESVWGLQGAGERKVGSTENENELVEPGGGMWGGGEGEGKEMW